MIQYLSGCVKINSPDHAYPVSVSRGAEESASGKPRIMVPIVGEEPPSALVQLALALGADAGEVVVLRPVSVAEQTPPKLAISQLDHHRAVLQDVVDTLPETAVSVESRIRIGHSVDDIIMNAVEDYGITALVLPSEACTPSSLPALVRPDLGTRICSSAECDVVVVRGTDRLSEITWVLAPIAGGPHSRLAVEVAAALAREFDASVDLLHVIKPNASVQRREQAECYLATSVERLEDIEQYETRLVEASDVADAIVEESAVYDLTIMGAPTKGRLQQFMRGSTTTDVENVAENAVLTVHRRDTGHSQFQTWIRRCSDGVR